MIFGSGDLLRLLGAAALSPRAGYAAAARIVPPHAAAIAARVREEVGRTLGEGAPAAEAGERFIASIACDDLDALTAALRRSAWRARGVRVEGGEHLPARGPFVLPGFHFSGGFRIFDLLTARGFVPAFPVRTVRDHPNLYSRALAAARTAHFRRVLGARLIEVGPGARERLRAHLGTGGVVVALLDVGPAALGLHDTAEVPFLGETLRLPVGLLRLAHEIGAPVLAHDGRIEDGQRVLRFHPPASGSSPEAVLRSVVATLEGVIRERPWDWQGWLDLEAFFASAR